MMTWNNIPHGGYEGRKDSKMYQTIKIHKFNRVNGVYVRDDGKYTITKKNDRLYIVKDSSGNDVASFSRLRFAKIFFETERK